MARPIGELVKQFRDFKTPTATIAERTGESQESIKRKLITHLGAKEYLKVARSIGGHAIAKRLRTDSEFSKAYSTHMSRLVVQSLKKRMQSKAFQQAWKKKAKEGSKKGVRRLRRLMKVAAFQDDWKTKCRIGGYESFERSVGIHAEKNAAARKRGALRGLEHTSRKTTGPNGERMYNDLERRVAEILKRKGIPYEYEKRFDTDTGNRFFSIDFCIGENCFVEVTDWDDEEAKSEKLNRKYRILREANQTGFEFIVVTTPGRVSEYRRHLEKDIRVLCPKEFKTLLAS